MTKSSAPVRGLAGALSVGWWCVLVVSVAATSVAVVVTTVDAVIGGAPSGPGPAEVVVVLSFLPVLLGVVAIHVLVVGVPAAMLLVRLLAPVRSEVAHVAVFAAVGAVLAVLLLLAEGGDSGLGPAPAALGAAAGLTGAGGGRWIAGIRAVRAARRFSDPRADEVAEDALLDRAEARA